MCVDDARSARNCQFLSGRSCFCPQRKMSTPSRGSCRSERSGRQTVYLPSVSRSRLIYQGGPGRLLMGNGPAPRDLCQNETLLQVRGQAPLHSKRARRFVPPRCQCEVTADASIETHLLLILFDKGWESAGAVGSI